MIHNDICVVGNPYAGMRLIYSTAALRAERVRRYAKRRAKSPRHWARMDKKYHKRYGMRQVPECYMFNGDTLVVHPALKPDVEQMLTASTRFS